VCVCVCVCVCVVSGRGSAQQHLVSSLSSQVDSLRWVCSVHAALVNNARWRHQTCVD